MDAITPRTLDANASSVTLRTRAKGMLARFAHDLEITARRFDADIQAGAGGWQATLVFPVAELRVAGALRDGRVDPSVLSPSDRDEIERKIRSEVLPGREVVVRASGDSPERGQAEVLVPTGRQQLPLRLSQKQQDGATIVFGKLSLSLRALQIREIKAPLGAFKVDDSIEIAFWMQLAGDAG